MKRPVGVSLSEEVLDMLDSKRGFAARSALIEYILRERFGMPQLPRDHRARGAIAIKEEGAERRQ
jgi:metal-responsive CopG/Arc/MetJ family transcriptional regulator